MTIAVVFALLAGISVAKPPSHAELVDAIIAERERIRTLHVITIAQMEVPKERTAYSALYLDVATGRWRVDSTGFVDGRTPINPEMELGFVKKMSVYGEYLHTYYPANAQVVATREYLKHAIGNHSILPFPDPRNAGLIAVFGGNIGTPFERGGIRLAISTGSVQCVGAEQIRIEPVVWDGEDAWAVEADWNPEPGRGFFRRFVVVPRWDYAVVSLETHTRRGDESTPIVIYAVQTEVALHGPTGIWFPSHVHYTARSNDKSIHDEVTEFQIASLNEPLPESVFTFKGMGVPAGHTVSDGTDRYIGKKIWDGEQIVLLSATPPVLSDGGGRYSRWLLIGLAVTALAGALVLWRSAARR